MLAAGAVSTLVVPSGGKAHADGATSQFIDSLGRTVVVPAGATAVTPLGVQAQTLMEILCGENLVSLALSMDADAADYRAAGLGSLLDLPQKGERTSSATLADMLSADAEELAAAGSSALDAAEEELNAAAAAGAAGDAADAQSFVLVPGTDLILDVGLARDGLAAELDALQEATGVPCVFLDISFGRLAQAFEMLGGLVSVSDPMRAATLAAYVRAVQEGTVASPEDVADRGACSVFYAQRDKGLMVRDGIEVQHDAIAHIGAVPYGAAYNYASRTVDVEMLSPETVDLVVFDDTRCLSQLLDGEGEIHESWGASEAVGQGRFAVAPALMHSWFGSPVMAQTIGLLWLSQIIGPTITRGIWCRRPKRFTRSSTIYTRAAPNGRS